MDFKSWLAKNMSNDSGPHVYPKCSEGEACFFPAMTFRLAVCVLSKGCSRPHKVRQAGCPFPRSVRHGDLAFGAGLGPVGVLAGHPEAMKIAN